MRLLFVLDAKNYNRNGAAFVRPSVRGIILRGNTIAMVHSMKYDYYKFPGGGIEPGERHEDTLIREVAEEAGLAVISDTIRPYGYVHRAEKRTQEDIFVQDNYYYLCEAEPECHPQRLDAYEAEERFTLEFVDPTKAIAANRKQDHGPKAPAMIEREARVLELLMQEGYFSV